MKKQTPSQLLAKEENWVQGRDFVSSNGGTLYSDGPDVERFCLRGAVVHSYDFNSGEFTQFMNIAHEVIRDFGLEKPGDLFISDWNDNPETTHAQVVAVAKETERRMQGLPPHTGPKCYDAKVKQRMTKPIITLDDTPVVNDDLDLPVIKPRSDHDPKRGNRKK